MQELRDQEEMAIKLSVITPASECLSSGLCARKQTPGDEPQLH